MSNKLITFCVPSYNSQDYLIELKTKQEKELLSALGQVNGVEEYSLMTQTGEVRF